MEFGEMSTYNGAYKRIPITMPSGRAVFEYGGGRGSVLTLQLSGVATDTLYKPYLLFEDSFYLLPTPLAVDKSGRCALRCELPLENPEAVRAVAVISEDLQPFAIGYIDGEYDWRKCFMMDTVNEAREVSEPVADTAPKEDKKAVFRSIVCRLDDDLRELSRYADINSSKLNEEALFKRTQAVVPFYGCDGEWIRLNIGELALTPFLNYINNPFVLYAYKHYGYLLLGKDGEGYMLGIPWRFDPSYRPEASVQGFKEIHPVQNVPLAKGVECCLIAHE
jgi:hypothetical protein